MRRREGAYRAYLAGAVVLVAVAPLARMLFIALLEPASIAWLTSPAFAEQLRVLSAAVVPLGLLVGTTRGPALLDPFATVTLGSNHVPRRRSLRRPFRRSVLAASVGTGILVCLLGAALVVGSGAPLVPVACFAAAAVALAYLGVVAALVGQVIGSLRAWVAAIALGLLGVSPLGVGAWFGSIWTGVVGRSGGNGQGLHSALEGFLGHDGGLSLVLVGALALLGVLAAALVSVPRLLDRLRGDALLRQARRREAAAFAAAAGELSGASAAYRELPSVGRGLHAVVGGPRVLSMLVRDAVGALRTPQRTAFGLVGVVVAALLMGLAVSPSAVTALAALGGSILMFLALAPFTEGFRHAADAAAGAAVFGTPTAEQFLLHAVFPLIVILLVVGVTLLVSSGGGGGAAPLLASLAMVAVRAYEAGRGHLPPLLLTPMPSEVGDVSVLARLVWQLDSVIIAALLGLATTMLWTVGLPVVSVVLLLAGAFVLALATRSRLRHLRG
ncbi:hypothetical protein [Pseudoclavibacter sp. 8L]|uniref:hypothetical protein n=1 Tax=Pseudoclavibacter sp. 8L TaxID=2653162 RepID=UPI001F460387|nr:hypothetical protein [Pseudoclavibacter sp. 8L]